MIDICATQQSASLSLWWCCRGRRHCRGLLLLLLLFSTLLLRLLVLVIIPFLSRFLIFFGICCMLSRLFNFFGFDGTILLKKKVLWKLAYTLRDQVKLYYNSEIYLIIFHNFSNFTDWFIANRAYHTQIICHSFARVKVILDQELNPIPLRENHRSKAANWPLKFGSNWNWMRRFIVANETYKYGR